MRDIFASIGGIVDSVMADAKSDVTYVAYVSDPGDGAPAFATPVTVQAYVSRKRRRVVTDSGSVYMIVATLIFTDARPVHPRDVFTLADGTTAPIVSDGGAMDPVTNQPYVTTVMLGNLARG